MKTELFEKIIDKKTISHEEWLNARKQGIGGSEASAIVGQNPYSSKLKVYLNKTQPITEADKANIENEATRQGNDLEDYVARRFAEQSGKKIQNCYYILRSKEHPFMIADLDRVVVGENSFVECKTTKNYDNYKFSENEFPAYWFWQIQHYFVVTGCEKCYLCILDFGRSYNVIEVLPDKRAMDVLIKMESEFWKNYVVPKITPYADSPVDTETINSIYTADTEIPDIDLSNDKSTIQEYAELKAKKKEIDEAIEGYENRLKQLLGNGTCGVCDTYKLTWKEQTRATIDSKKLKTTYPEVYNECTKTSVSRVFRFSQKE